jgi:hypothetical protein
MDINTRMNDLLQTLAMLDYGANVAAPAGSSHDDTPPMDPTPALDPTITTTTEDSPSEDALGVSTSPMPLSAGSDEEAHMAPRSEWAIWG